MTFSATSNRPAAPAGVIPDLPGVVVDPPRVAELRTSVAQLLGLPNERFPGAQPVSFLERHIADLEAEDFFVCEKSDGVRCLVYAVVNPRGQPETYLIDRKNNYRFVPNLQFPNPPDRQPPPFHNGTLFDGELVVDQEPDGRSYMTMYCFDLLASSGENLMPRSLMSRLGYLKEHVIRPYQRLVESNPRFAQAQPFRVVAKSMELSYGLNKVLREDIPKLKHKNDGLIFVSVKSPYIPGTTEKMLKWKPAHENSVDFRVNLEYPQGGGLSARPRFVLSAWQGGQNYVQFGELGLTDEEWNHFRQNGIQLENRIVEVTYNPDHCPPAQWQFMRFREDKPHANFITVVERVIQSIREGITQDELMSRCPSIRESWKARPRP
ncbi:Dcp1p-Dcp2p decapping enzyme complex alpha subunit [Tieghemiomyces parasiticus]|uniref:mRNA-capping enzyme subunit alpha n=1 Tax=Tieghemiomyces parasiticus TaxID=78921 RepID=A0A9W8A6U3_9FUNG|nr:Dcp1p-Dcp2p decapping enzyme complex alpha subunit [Tieghemiomyces parasiticus]